VTAVDYEGNCRHCDAPATYPVYRPLQNVQALGYRNKRWALAVLVAGLRTPLPVLPPLLKKLSLDPDNPTNHRPISNLNNISKILTNLFLSRLQPRVFSSPNFNMFQSAYRQHATALKLLSFPPLTTFTDLLMKANHHSGSQCCFWHDLPSWSTV